MKFIKYENTDIVKVVSDELLIKDIDSALDLMATVKYEMGSHQIIVDKSAVIEEFFDLKTRLAGEILQKFIIYDVKIAIIGDYSIYESKSLKDFIYECNKGKDIFFLEDENIAVEKMKAIL